MHCPKTFKDCQKISFSCAISSSSCMSFEWSSLPNKALFIQFVQSDWRSLGFKIYFWQFLMIVSKFHCSYRLSNIYKRNYRSLLAWYLPINVIHVVQGVSGFLYFLLNDRDTLNPGIYWRYFSMVRPKLQQKLYVFLFVLDMNGSMELKHIFFNKRPNLPSSTCIFIYIHLQHHHCT